MCGSVESQSGLCAGAAEPSSCIYGRLSMDSRTLACFLFDLEVDLGHAAVLWVHQHNVGLVLVDSAWQHRDQSIGDPQGLHHGVSLLGLNTR